MVAAPSTIDIKDAGGVTKTMGTMLEGTEHKATHVVADEGPIPRAFRRYLDTAGNGTGTKNAVGDYSSAATNFYILPGSGVVYRIKRLTILIEDAAISDDAQYGGLAALTNGITVEKHNGTSQVDDYTDGITVKKHRDWAAFGASEYTLLTQGVSNDSLIITIDFPTPIRLDGDSTERFQCALNDDFTGLVSHYLIVDGETETDTV